MKHSAEDFVKAWATSASVDEVAKKLDTKKGSIVQRALYMKKKGVRLPNIHQDNRVKLDVPAINAMIALMGK